MWKIETTHIQHLSDEELSLSEPFLGERSSVSLLKGTRGSYRNHLQSWIGRTTWIVLGVASTLLTTALCMQYLWSVPREPSRTCAETRIRKEWRTLNTTEKLDYIEAVKCITTLPSGILANATLHDDFAYVHFVNDKESHDSAPFLPWHRYFIHVYESTLQTRCHYRGSLPYWDWLQDWDNLTASPVFDSKEGFGGNGDTSTPATVGFGHCVADGPFANLQVQFYAGERKPHCLSRGFIPESIRHIFGSDMLNATAMAYVMNAPDYRSFLVRLEEGPHLAAPYTIQGDFRRLTAPNDPLFYLHHAQLDRLWWEWQKKDINARSIDYSGPAQVNSSHEAKLSDMITIPHLAPGVPVRSFMKIHDSLLCYDYT